MNTKTTDQESSGWLNGNAWAECQPCEQSAPKLNVEPLPAYFEADAVERAVDELVELQEERWAVGLARLKWLESDRNFWLIYGILMSLIALALAMK